jgi:hypothetical protein
MGREGANIVVRRKATYPRQKVPGLSKANIKDIRYIPGAGSTRTGCKAPHITLLILFIYSMLRNYAGEKQVKVTV